MKRVRVNQFCREVNVKQEYVNALSCKDDMQGVTPPENERSKAVKGALFVSPLDRACQVGPRQRTVKTDKHPSGAVPHCVAFEVP